MSQIRTTMSQKSTQGWVRKRAFFSVTQFPLCVEAVMRNPRLFVGAIVATLVIAVAGCSDLTSPEQAPEVAANGQGSGI